MEFAIAGCDIMSVRRAWSRRPARRSSRTTYEPTSDCRIRSRAEWPDATSGTRDHRPGIRTHLPHGRISENADGPPLPHVALIVETSTAYGRAILSGISQFVREHGPWTVYIEQRSLQDPAPPWLELALAQDGDGIIARRGFRLPKSGPDSSCNSGVPTVDLNDQVRGLGLPQIHSDHAAIARLAAEHLMDRGFRHFTYFGFPVVEWSVRREQAFTQHVLPGRPPVFTKVCQPVASPGVISKPPWEDEIERVAQWVRQLPKPLGIMAGNDIRGMQMLDACRLAGVAVPEEAAVVGVDNEELVCLVAYPPLSSVIPDAYRIGYEAAGMLDLMMKGQPVSELLRTIPPLSVATRQSSDVTAIANPSLAKAMQFIREYACQGIGVDDVLDHLTVSRSILQRLFRKELGRIGSWTRSPPSACSASSSYSRKRTCRWPKSPTAPAMRMWNI